LARKFQHSTVHDGNKHVIAHRMCILLCSNVQKYVKNGTSVRDETSGTLITWPIQTIYIEPSVNVTLPCLGLDAPSQVGPLVAQLMEHWLV